MAHQASNVKQAYEAELHHVDTAFGQVQSENPGLALGLQANVHCRSSIDCTLSAGLQAQAVMCVHALAETCKSFK